MRDLGFCLRVLGFSGFGFRRLTRIRVGFVPAALVFPGWHESELALVSVEAHVWMSFSVVFAYCWGCYHFQDVEVQVCHMQPRFRECNVTEPRRISIIP